MKKIISAIIISTVLMSTSVFANEVSNSKTNQSIEVQNFSNAEKVIATKDVSKLDLDKPYIEINEFTDENGDIVTITNTYVPNKLTKGSSTNTASSGIWTSRCTTGIMSMSYRFDLSKSGSSWKISNAREHLYSGLLTEFTNPLLKISRATSTSSYPAEVYATVQVEFAGSSSTCLLRTSISNNGIMTTYWN